MDRRDSFILDIINKSRSNNLEGYWELLSTAANDKEAVEKSVNCISFEELHKGAMSKLSISPSLVEMRIEALSVWNIELLQQIWEKIKGVNEDNPFMQTAKNTLKKIIYPHKVDFNLEPWHWSDKINATPIEGFLLSQRPIHEKNLTTNDLIIATNNGGGVLRALRYQNISMQYIDFTYWMKNISSVDPWALALIIELSKKINMPIERWRKAFREFFTDISDPCEVIPFIYVLISPNWNVP